MQKAGQGVKVYKHTQVSPMVLRVVDVSPFRASSGKEVHCLAQADEYISRMNRLLR